MPAIKSLPAQYWTQNGESLLKALVSQPDGLSSSEAEQRLVQLGANVLRAKRKTTPLAMFLGQLTSPIMLILLFATLVSAFLGDWVDALIIAIIVLGSAVLSFVQEYRADHAAEKLRAQVVIKSKVMRDGKVVAIPSEEVVPGDILILSAGNLVPADGVVFEANEFFVNQAVLTGETFPVEKRPDPVAAGAGLSERSNCIYMGTSTRSGTAKALVVRTGADTEFGQIAHNLSLRPPETEFERGVRQFGLLLSEVMLILVLGIFAFNVYFQKPVLDSLLFSVALAVGLTPQLLPAIININLSKGSQSMARVGVIVRKLNSIENFGSMDTLCTDKTGTLTVGVVKLDAANDVDGNPSKEVFRYAFINARFQTGMTNPMDEAIVSDVKTEDQPALLGDATKLDEIPYDFVRKRLSVVVSENGIATMVTKGALEPVLSICTQVRGNPMAVLDEAQRSKIMQLYHDWSEQGFRVLGVAVKPVDPLPANQPYQHEHESDMIFAGYLLFFDPPKPGVIDTIRELRESGVNLKMITGDNHLVAKHAAVAVGLEVTGVVTGSQIQDMRDEALWHMVEEANVFSEVDPNQKEHIILALKKHGHVVGYMGDGINDAPALHSADVGISVDTAVDVAKEAADFVLLKQDLDVLHRGIIEGRKTFANTLKYVFMATSANFGNMFSVAGASLFLPFLPLLPKQILLINFLTDLPEMTISSDQVDDEYLRRPRRWNIRFIRNFMLVFGTLSSVFDYLTFGTLLLLLHANENHFRTGWYVESVLSASLVVFAIRTRLPIFRSHPSGLMMFVTACVAAITLAIPYTPLGVLMELPPLPVSYLLAMVGIVLLYFISAEAAKRVFYRKFDR